MRKSWWVMSKEDFTDRVKFQLYIHLADAPKIGCVIVPAQTTDPVTFTSVQNPSTCRIQDHLHCKTELQN